VMNYDDDLEGVSTPIRVSNPYRSIRRCIRGLRAWARSMGSEGGLYGITQYALFTPEHI